MTSGDDQISADENASACPERASIIVIFSNPNFANGAVRPDIQTGVDLVLEDVFDGIIILGLEFADDVGALGLVSVFRNVGFGRRDFSVREASRLVTLGDFETGFLHAAFDFDRVETALCLTALRFRAGRAVFWLGNCRLVCLGREEGCRKEASFREDADFR